MLWDNAIGNKLGGDLGKIKIGPREKWESLKKKFFFRETHFYSVSCGDNLLPLHCIFLAFNGNGICNG